jgi:hypothetical protein
MHSARDFEAAFSHAYAGRNMSNADLLSRPDLLYYAVGSQSNHRENINNNNNDNDNNNNNKTNRSSGRITLKGDKFVDVEFLTPYRLNSRYTG